MRLASANFLARGKEWVGIFLEVGRGQAYHQRDCVGLTEGVVAESDASGRFQSLDIGIVLRNRGWICCRLFVRT